MFDPSHQTSAHAPHEHDAHHLGVSLGPALRHACDGRLGEIEWFRCAWQHGGAATGFSTWRHDDRTLRPVMVKLPVGSIEHRWTTDLSRAAPPAQHAPTPLVLASGTEVGGYDFAWLVIERLDGQPISSSFTAEAVSELLRATARFHAAAASVRVIDETPRTPDWDGLLHKSREITKADGLSESRPWNEAVKRVQKVLPVLKAKWQGRRIHTWCHGDLHPGNAMRRACADGASACRECVLIDLAMVHAGHWIEDAVYLERLYWGRAEQLHGIKPVSQLAKLRRESNLPTDDNYAELAAVRRVLMAACVPAYSNREGHPRYTHAALEVLEQYLPQVAH